MFRPNLCGCPSHGALARYVALVIAEEDAFLARLRYQRHRLNPDGGLAYRNPDLEAARAAVWSGERDSFDAETAYFVERSAA